MSLLDPEIARTSVTEEQARFEALFTTDTSFAKTDAAVASQLTGSQTSAFDFNPGLQIPLLTGGSIQLGFPIDRFETNNQFSTLNPSYSAGPSAQLTLAAAPRVRLRRERPVDPRRVLPVPDRAGRDEARASPACWRTPSASTGGSTRPGSSSSCGTSSTTWPCAQLERARRQARAGMVPEVDVVRAESGVADQVEAIILAQNDLRARQRD